MTVVVRRAGGSRATPAAGSGVAVRRAVGTLHDPNAWTVGILLVTGVALIARHPIARALGTEVSNAPVAAPAVTAPPHATQWQVPSLSVPTVSVPTHEPRDPFAALSAVTAAAAAAPATTRSPATTTPVAAASSVPAGSCAGRVHRIAQGESLWTVAATAVRSANTGTVTFAWHRLYDANRAVIGPDPDLVRTGTALCVPSTLTH